MYSLVPLITSFDSQTHKKIHQHISIYFNDLSLLVIFWQKMLFSTHSPAYGPSSRQYLCRIAKRPVITTIIDWQGAEVLPLSLTARFPHIINYYISEDPVTVDMPPKLDSEDPTAKEDHEAVMVKKY